MFRTVLAFVVAALGVAAVAGLLDPAGAPVVAVVVVVAALAVALFVIAPTSHARGLQHPRVDSDVRVLPAQSDPDAAGHPRPRAPGSAAAAA